MPAITPVDPSVLPVIEEAEGAPRAVRSIVTAQASFEGAGFPVHRPFPQPGADLGATDPFLMLDEMGPIAYGPGEAKGAPDHPHRGFETVTYLFDGEMEHRDSTGGAGCYAAATRNG
jgi:redox-sensitive bicupin YhaK (pirin superfamily)